MNSASRHWIVGGGADCCDVVVDQPFVSRRHCRLTSRDDHFEIEDLGSTNGTYVNGLRIDRPTQVTRGDRITLGSDCVMPWPSELTEGVRIIRIGRDASNDVVLDRSFISAFHAVLEIGSGGAYLRDLNSSNGTAIGSPDNRISRAPLSSQDAVFLGVLRIEAADLLKGRVSLNSPAAAGLADLRRGPVVVGRDPSCDLVVDHPLVSARHARLTLESGRVVVEDLESRNGTFVDDRPIARRATIQPGDSLSLGSCPLRITKSLVVEVVDQREGVVVEARGVGVEAPGRKLLDDVSMTILPSEFVALMGPSGAGKTTLMNVLNGYTRPTEGAVLYNGKDLYSHYNQFSGCLGYVPQDDIMHRDLTVGEALYYTAKLRLPPDFSDVEIRQRIAGVLGKLGLDGVENILIGSPERKGISGGQRKRVNLAMEMLTDPQVLYLDEPTSGLSSEDALIVMKVLRSLADQGKVLLLTVHQPSPEAYQLTDHLALIGRDSNSSEPGRLAYFGPSHPDAIRFFNPEGSTSARHDSPDEVLRGLSKRPTKEWVDRFRRSKYFETFVRKRAAEQSSTNDSIPLRSPRVNSLQQWLTLVRRGLVVKWKDRWNTGILLAQAPIVALLIVMVFGGEVRRPMNDESWGEVARSLSMTIFMMGISSLWFGCSNAAREIVGEWAIYHRERMVNLRIGSYVTSKLAILGSLCAVQCLVLAGICSVGLPLRASWILLLGVLWSAAMVGVGVGLLLSSLARSSEVAIALLPIYLIPMVIVGGVMQPIHKMNPAIRTAAAVAPSRWTFEAMLSLESAQRPLGPSRLAGMVDHPGDQLRSDLAESNFPKGTRNSVLACSAMLWTLALLHMAGVVVVLRRRDVH